MQDRSIWSLKADGQLRRSLRVPLFAGVASQFGGNYARTLSIVVPTGSGLIASGTAYADAYDAIRDDHIWVFDVRTEKTVNFTSRPHVRLFFDLFNLTNSHASETISHATGLGCQKPSAILALRTARLGFRFLW